MRVIYQSIWKVVAPCLKWHLKRKSRQHEAYRDRMAERFAQKMPRIHRPVDVWIHAVSLGESIAITPLVQQLIKEHGHVLLTTMTPTGSAYVRNTFGDQLTHQYLPFDHRDYVRSFYQHHQPRVGVMMETEIWPNYLFEAAHRNMPMLLINARLSHSSYRSYRWIRWFLAPCLRLFAQIGTQSSADLQRFKDLGASDHQLQMLGNVKFDVRLPEPSVIATWAQLKQQWGQDRTVLILASTHAHEESQCMAQIKTMQQHVPGLLCLIAPRHPERWAEVEHLLAQSGLSWARKTQINDSWNRQVDVILVDTMGELMGAYACSDYAFVGGSLVERGGHNVLEPMAMGIPVCVGPYVSNFQWICDVLFSASALTQIQNAQEMVEWLVRMERNSDLREQQILNATRVMSNHQGATTQYFKLILSYLKTFD